MSILVDGIRVTSAVKSTLENPWVECSLPRTSPDVLVVQVQKEKYFAAILVFVDGINLDDGSTLDDWRARRPAPIDGFEQTFGGPFFGPWGAAFLGLVGALPFLAEFSRTKETYWLGWAVAGFIICSIWMLGGVLLIRWLKTKRTWPDPVRRLLVPFAMLGLPILITLAVATIASTL